MTLNQHGFDAAGQRLYAEVQQLTDAGVDTDGVLAALNAMDVATGDECANIVPDPLAAVKAAQAEVDAAEAAAKAKADAKAAVEKESAHPHK